MSGQIHTEKVLHIMSSPIIPWMGGKLRLADRLIPLFPPHECYVEVFAGGGALYFLRPQPAPADVLSDINGDLVTLYRVVQNYLEEFVRQFKWALMLTTDIRVAKNDPPGNPDRHPARRPILLPAAPYLWGQGCGTELWYRNNGPCN